MALQRTRGLSAAQVLRFAGRRSAVQGLPGGRSPLNAVALGAVIRTTAIAVVLLSPSTAQAGSAVRLSVIVPACVGPCPAAYIPPLTWVRSGVSYSIAVVALDSSGIIDPDYAGTVMFASSDPLATVPGSTTFDMGGRLLPNALALRSVGVQTITISDAAGVLASGTTALTVVAAGVTEAIPVLSETLIIVFAVLLLLTGFYVLSLRGA